MGTGRGQIRRLQTSLSGKSASLTQISFCDPGQWKRFVRENNTGGTNLYTYYMGGIPYVVKTTEHEEVMQEIFADAVEEGVVKLPTPHKAKDLKLKVASTMNGYRRVNISLISNPDANISTEHFDCYLDQHMCMENEEVYDFLQRLGEGLNTFFSSLPTPPTESDIREAQSELELVR